VAVTEQLLHGHDTATVPTWCVVIVVGQATTPVV
jgi:hypothetical protein